MILQAAGLSPRGLVLLRPISAMSSPHSVSPFPRHLPFSPVPPASLASSFLCFKFDKYSRYQQSFLTCIFACPSSSVLFVCTLVHTNVRNFLSSIDFFLVPVSHFLIAEITILPCLIITMPSVRMTVLALAATFVAVANSDYVIDPDSVDKSTRESWCSNEKQTCPVICEQTGDGSTKVNDCDPDTLTYGCICGDGKQPNVSEYSLTLPYFVCQEWGNQCVAKCGNSNTCASDCRQNHPCGAQDPKKVNKTKTATGTTASATGTSTDTADTIYTDIGSDSTDSADSKDKGGAAMALEAGSRWGLAVVLGSMFAGFALL
ncbi:hypothetical protein BGZ63DRAFT_371620 [Mariannaea sp. PMI_226]|nr:hypothetical protein BGZ63DRAFT_371620 [Mariannaea sp. PMI_226]